MPAFSPPIDIRKLKKSHFLSRKFAILLLLVIVLFLLMVFTVYCMRLKLHGGISDINNLSWLSTQGENSFFNPKPTSEPSPTPNLTPQPEKISKPAQGRIALVMDGDIWTIDADRSDLEQITDDEEMKFGLGQAPDKHALVYSFYPKDPDKRTNQGYYEGFNSGVSVVDLASKEVTTIIPYGDTQNHYASWSLDSMYISAWVSNGANSVIKDAQNGETKLVISGDKDQGVSPIVWLAQDNKISYISNGQLIRSDIDGSNEEVLVDENADAYRRVHEGPNVPEPPIWSPSERYVGYISDGDLRLLDTVNKTDVLVVEGDVGELFDEKYPQGFIISFSPDEKSLYLLDYTKEKTGGKFDITSGQYEGLVDFGNDIIVSPNQKYIIGTEWGSTPVYEVEDEKLKQCNEGSDYDTGFHYDYYSWASGLSYNTRQVPWSYDSLYLIGHIGGSGNLAVMTVDSCDMYEVVRGNIGDAIWL